MLAIFGLGIGKEEGFVFHPLLIVGGHARMKLVHSEKTEAL